MNKIYIVISEWQSEKVLEGGSNINGAFFKKENAIDCLNKITEEEKNNSALGQNSDVVIEQDINSFCMYEKGNYFGNHFNCKIITTELN